MVLLIKQSDSLTSIFVVKGCHVKYFLINDISTADVLY